MAENLSLSSEKEPQSNIDVLVGDYFSEDADFFAGLDEEDKIGAVYGQLLEAGEDPDLVFENYKITGENDE